MHNLQSHNRLISIFTGLLVLAMHMLWHVLRPLVYIYTCMYVWGVGGNEKKTWLSSFFFFFFFLQDHLNYTCLKDIGGCQDILCVTKSCTFKVCVYYSVFRLPCCILRVVCVFVFSEVGGRLLKSLT